MCELKILMYLLNKILGAERGYFWFFEGFMRNRFKGYRFGPGPPHNRHLMPFNAI